MKKLIVIFSVLLIGITSGACGIIIAETKQSDSSAEAKNKTKDITEVKEEGEEKVDMVILENVKIVFPKESGLDNPVIYDTVTNNTDKKITGYKQGMLAFDKDGTPLKIYWVGIDSSIKKSYYHLYTETDVNLLPGQTTEMGGWTLLSMRGDEEDKQYYKIAYVLYCFKEITFEDGEIWTNPNYSTWTKTYKGKSIDVKNLKKYYPLNHNISK
jgi:uncharacterized protein (UPF0333 family)